MSISGWKGDEVPVVRCKRCGGWINYETKEKITCVCGGGKHVQKGNR